MNHEISEKRHRTSTTKSLFIPWLSIVVNWSTQKNPERLLVKTYTSEFNSRNESGRLNSRERFEICASGPLSSIVKLKDLSDLCLHLEIFTHNTDMGAYSLNSDLHRKINSHVLILKNNELAYNLHYVIEGKHFKYFIHLFKKYFNK